MPNVTQPEAVESPSAALTQLTQLGVSVWLDDLSRESLDSGLLARLTTTRDVVGVTTNPTIFAGALTHSRSYAEQIRRLAAAGISAEQAVVELTTRDVVAAADILAPIHARTEGRDGWVSLEVAPQLAHDTAATIEQAVDLAKRCNRANVMIKIPATSAGLPAISAVISHGISVNATLIFSVDRYRAVIDAYEMGLEQALAAGRELPKIHSVASFFVSRVDTEVDRRLDAIGSPAARALRSKAAVANARLAYDCFLTSTRSRLWRGLAARGATLQRLLWASTGVKDPALAPSYYVMQLAAPDIVNTVPRKTLEAVAGAADFAGDTLENRAEESRHIIDQLAALGIDYGELTELLEREGVGKFVTSWDEMLKTVAVALAQAH
jgi:transaldolase